MTPARTAECDRRGVIMNAGTEVTPLAVSRIRPSQKFLEIGYFTAITVATVGWVSAFGWITVRAVEWLLG
jgi:hypothetical protein